MPLELLESRLAPASVFAWTDVDGDEVRWSSRGTSFLPEGEPEGLGLRVDTLHVMAGGDGSFSLTVKKAFGGDGLVHIGTLDAEGQRLGRVFIEGNVGAIQAGDGLAGFAIRSLELQNLGPESIRQSSSSITGAIGTLLVHGDVRDLYMEVGGRGNVHNPSIGRILVGGDISHWLLDANQGIGRIFAGGSVEETILDAKVIRIGGTVTGGLISGTVAGIAGDLLRANLFVHSGVIGGDLVGGDGVDGFPIPVEATALLRVGGDMIDATVFHAGTVSVGGSLIRTAIERADSVHVHGSMRGGSIGGLPTSFVVLPELPPGVPPLVTYITRLGSVVIEGSMSDGAAIIGESIGSVRLGGDLRDATILSRTSIGAIVVNGSVYGRIAAGDEAQGGRGTIGVIWIAGDLGRATAASSLAGSIIARDGTIGTLMVGGDIAGGLAARTGWVNAPRGIGALWVGGDILGGAGVFSGTIQADRGAIANRFVGGDLVPSGSIGSGLVVSAGVPVVST